MRIVLIRHPAPAIAPGICYGRLDVALAAPVDCAGPNLVADPALRTAKRVWSSPATRCRTPGSGLARALGLPLCIDPRLRELDFGEWEGQAWDAIPRDLLDQWASAPLSFAPPNGESGASLITRVLDFHATLRRDDQDCIIISHGGPLKLLYALLLGRALDLLAPAPPIGWVSQVAVSPVRPEAPQAAPARQRPCGSTAPVPATG